MIYSSFIEQHGDTIYNRGWFENSLCEKRR